MWVFPSRRLSFSLSQLPPLLFLIVSHNILEFFTGTNVSTVPCTSNTGHAWLTFLKFSPELNLFAIKCAPHAPACWRASSFNEWNGERQTMSAADFYENSAATAATTAEPIDRPSKMMCFISKSVSSSINFRTYLASLRILSSEQIPSFQLTP